MSVLEDMKQKGRIRVASGGVGNDIKYIIELPAEKGHRRLRLVTDRTLAFQELYQGTRSRDYAVGAIELDLTPGGKGSGTVPPACKLTVNKKKQRVEFETYQNPWNLSNFMISKDCGILPKAAFILSLPRLLMLSGTRRGSSNRK